MTAAEEPRRLLDGRGVEWKDGGDGVHPITVWHDKQFSYEYMERTLLDGVKPHTGEVVDGTGRLEAVIHVCTPEQAIVATLGVADATGERHGGAGTLTAEQVRDAVMSADRWEKPMGNTGLTNTHLIIRDDGWQAIADELNATLGSCNCTNGERTNGTCRDVRSADHIIAFECSECGCWVAYDEYWETGIYVPDETGQEHIHPRYCPNCGAKVVQR